MLTETTRNNNNILPEETKYLMQPPRIPNNSTLTSTPQNNNNGAAELSAINTQTVTKKRTRQQTVTVDNAFPSKEIENIFNRVQNLNNSENQMLELQQQIQMFFNQKEREWENKLIQNKPSDTEDLALCKIKLKSAESMISRMEDFNKLLRSKSQLISRLNNPNSFDFQNNNEIVGTPRNNNGYPLSPSQIDELTRERNSLREDMAQMENNYADLFKRYEKLRESCVLLKNSEEELKNTLVDEAAKYERLLNKFKELRDVADGQLNQANLEIQRIIKQHEENTLGLRCRLKMNETQIQTLNLTIQGKDKQIEELNKMVEELMEKNGLTGDIDDDIDGGATSPIFTPGFE